MQKVSYSIDPLINYIQYTGSVINYFEMLSSRTYIQIDITDALNLSMTDGFKWENQVNYAMLINLVTVSTLNYNGYSPDCQAVGGFRNTKGEYVYCRAHPTVSVGKSF